MRRNAGTTTSAREQPSGREHWNTFSAQKGACQCRFALSNSMHFCVWISSFLRRRIESMNRITKRSKDPKTHRIQGFKHPQSKDPRTQGPKDSGPAAGAGAGAATVTQQQQQKKQKQQQQQQQLPSNSSRRSSSSNTKVAEESRR